jgi:sugar lactone lactonase YvrE
MPELEAQLRAYGSVLDHAEAVAVDMVDAAPRVRRSLVVAIAAAVVLAIVGSALAVNATRSRDVRPPRVFIPPPSHNRSSGVLAIGDSVMLGAKSSLESAVPGIRVDAVLSRQFVQAIQVVEADKAASSLPATIVVHLGTNGRVTDALFDQLMRAVGPGHAVYFVTARVPRVWETEVNDTLRSGVARRPGAHLIDWHGYAGAHDDWFTTDGFHLTAAGQSAYALLVATAIGRPPVTPTTAAPAPSGLDVVDVIPKTALPPSPLAVAGGDVWIATESVTSSPLVHLERRDPASAKVVQTIDVPQEAVFAIAGDGDTLWVAGGGDGGVPQTTVSRVDTATGKVVFTKTLAGTPCSCPIVAGDAGVWLVGNGSGDALHLSSTDGHVIADVRLPARVTAHAAMETSARLVLGLDDGTIAVVDPATNRIERSIARPVVGDPPVEAVVAMSPAAIPAVGSDPPIDGLVVRANGSVSALVSSRWEVEDFVAVSFSASTVAEIRGLTWTLGGDRLEVASTHAVVANEFAYDAARHEFDRVADGPADQLSGFRGAVTAGGMLWVEYDATNANGSPSIVVVKAPESFPFK